MSGVADAPRLRMPYEEMSLASKFPFAAIAMMEITKANADQRFAFGLGLQIEGLKAVLHSS
ncbi:TetR/AcrR family transcriptional regulator C-terminal domain-containing protein [Rhizobium laguerreae]|uniref:TetR/AcrR family transcriptional regulator C-terminal domain-containing protein n=1 Tax=Rhizobium laguerreae TaxID=1076926 RepID=UPI0028AEDD69|nr:TetR/AcrR family transcriptional regulator C-terminal domain-containing protein [Rhizobium laguerreae]